MTRTGRRKARGQNLVEMVLTFPFLIAIIFCIMEVGRAWQTYEGAKLAALDGAYTASVFHDANRGRLQIDKRLKAAKLNVKSFDVQSVNNGHSFRATTTVIFKPVFGGLKIPSLAGDITIIPSQFDISYTDVKYYAIY